jgi:hypothetical protein
MRIYAATGKGSLLFLSYFAFVPDSSDVRKVGHRIGGGSVSHFIEGIHQLTRQKNGLLFRKQDFLGLLSVRVAYDKQTLGMRADHQLLDLTSVCLLPQP